MGGELLSFNGEEDDVHLMVCVPPQKAVAHFVGRLKGASFFSLRRGFRKEIRKNYGGKAFVVLATAWSLAEVRL